MASSQTKKPFNLHKWLRSRKGQQAVIIVLFMIVYLLTILSQKCSSSASIK